MQIYTSRKLWGTLALLNALILGYLVMSGKWLLDPSGAAHPHDFASLWSAGLRVWHSEASLAYDWPSHILFQQKLFHSPHPVMLGFFHPPHFLFVVSPFATMGYIPAAVTFLAASALLYILALRLIVKDALLAIGMALALGASFICFWWVQIGFLIAALLIGGLALMRRYPLLAGIIFGILTIKPQLGVVLALALLLSKEWKTIGAAIVTTLILAAGAELCFGPGIWAAFIESTKVSSDIMLSGKVGFKAQSTYALALPLVGQIGALLIHVCAAGIALAVFIFVWLSKVSFNVKASSLVATTLLVTPYLFPYDAVMLTGSVAFLLTDPKLTNNWEKTAIVAASLLPALSGWLLSGAVPLASWIILYVGARQVAIARQMSGTSADSSTSATQFGVAV